MAKWPANNHKKHAAAARKGWRKRKGMKAKSRKFAHSKPKSSHHKRKRRHLTPQQKAIAMVNLAKARAARAAKRAGAPKAEQKQVVKAVEKAATGQALTSHQENLLKEFLDIPEMPVVVIEGPPPPTHRSAGVSSRYPMAFGD